MKWVASAIIVLALANEARAESWSWAETHWPYSVVCQVDYGVGPQRIAFTWDGEWYKTYSPEEGGYIMFNRAGVTRCGGGDLLNDYNWKYTALGKPITNQNGYWYTPIEEKYEDNRYCIAVPCVSAGVAYAFFFHLGFSAIGWTSRRLLEASRSIVGA